MHRATTWAGIRAFTSTTAAILSVEETSDYILNNVLGLAFPLLWSLEAAAELQLDYDAGAVEGVDKLDQTYRLRLGYTW